jgi:hypothetical protein
MITAQPAKSSSADRGFGVKVVGGFVQQQVAALRQRLLARVAVPLAAQQQAHLLLLVPPLKLPGSYAYMMCIFG